ncbi:MAG: glycine zipper 2TM domain-containing protein [Pseudomonadota bacterium]
MKRFLIAANTCLMVAVLSACSTTSPDVIKPGDAQRLSQVEDAVVLNVRPVVVEGSQSGLGGGAGAVIGGVGGSTVGGSRDQVVVGVIGAVVGGVVGNAVERFGTREDAVELLLQTSNGQRRSIVQAKGNEKFVAGDAVLLVTTGGKIRVMKAPPSVAPLPTPAR